MSAADTTSERFSQVTELLAKATERKLLLRIHETDIADLISTLERANHLAQGLPDPLPAICAYRLAHLLLRQNNPDLHRIDKLFALAALSDELGVYPDLYRLAVQTRLAADSTTLTQIYQRARQRLQLGAAAQGYRHAGIQRPEFNMLELAACCAGLRHLQELDGLGGIEWFQHYRHHQAWVVLRHDSIEAAVPRSKKDALRTLDKLKEELPGCIYFVLDAEQARLGVAGKPEVELMNQRQRAEYLAVLLMRNTTGPEARQFSGPAEKAMPSHPTANSLYSMKSQLRQQLATWLGREIALANDVCDFPVVGAAALGYLLTS